MKSILVEKEAEYNFKGKAVEKILWYCKVILVISSVQASKTRRLFVEVTFAKTQPKVQLSLASGTTVR